MAIPLRDDLMVQEQINNDPWSHMVAVVMLNQTGRKQVKTILPQFLALWPDAASLLAADIAAIIEIIKPLGMYNRRAKILKRMSQDWQTWDGQDARALHGIGRYGSDSYRIFFRGELNIDPTDKELRRYLGLAPLQKQDG